MLLLRSNPARFIQLAAFVLATWAFAFLAPSIASAGDSRGHGGRSTLEGVVDGAGKRQPGYVVSLYASHPPQQKTKSREPRVHLLGHDTTDRAGRSTIEYQRPGRGRDAVLYVLAEKGKSKGNVWLMNNWKKTGPYQPVYQTNPGGNSFVIVPGAVGRLDRLPAKPQRTRRCPESTDVSPLLLRCSFCPSLRWRTQTPERRA